MLPPAVQLCAGQVHYGFQWGVLVLLPLPLNPSPPANKLEYGFQCIWGAGSPCQSVPSHQCPPVRLQHAHPPALWPRCSSSQPHQSNPPLPLSALLSPCIPPPRPPARASVSVLPAPVAPVSMCLSPPPPIPTPPVCVSPACLSPFHSALLPHLHVCLPALGLCLSPGPPPRSMPPSPPHGGEGKAGACLSPSWLPASQERACAWAPSLPA